MTEASFITFKRNFGRRLSALRRQRGLTQEALARLVKMDPVSIAYLEGAQRGPSFQTVYRLSRALDVQASEFFD